MKTRFSFIVLCIAAALFIGRSTVWAQETNDAKTVYVIPIEDKIDRALVYVIRRGVTEALDTKADAIIFDMDTPGGRLDVTKEIISIISDIDVKTYTFVNPDAISAGAIISLATDAIYMAPGSRIGDSMPIIMTPTGDVQKPDENLQEKIVSPTAALIRGTAQRKGYDSELAECMVRRELEYKIGDKVICKKGELLTLTNVEAEYEVERDGKMEKLLSSGTVKSVEDLMKEVGLENATKKELVVTNAERIARYIELFSAIFLMGGILGLYMEFKTPGFGVPGILGIILLAIWFWGHNIAGLANILEVMLFTTGVALIIAEIFFIPGFGIAGISGITLLIIALITAMVEHLPGGTWFPPLTHINYAARTLSLSFFSAGVGMVFLTRYLPKTSAFDRLTIEDTIDDKVSLKAAEAHQIEVGMKGLTTTELRPSGMAEFNGKRIDVISNGDFINIETPVEIAEIQGNRVIVKVASQKGY